MLLQYIIDRLSEGSTWRGILAFATAAGATVNPEQAAAIIAAGLAFMGVVGVFFKEKKEPSV